MAHSSKLRPATYIDAMSQVPNLMKEGLLRPIRCIGSRQDVEGTLDGVLLEETYKLKSTATPSAKECYKDRLTVTKHNGFNVPIGAIKIGFLSRITWSDFFEQANEGKR